MNLERNSYLRFSPDSFAGGNGGFVEVNEYLDYEQKIQDQPPFNWLFLDIKGDKLLNMFPDVPEEELRLLLLKAVSRRHFDPNLETFGWRKEIGMPRVLREGRFAGTTCQVGRKLMKRWHVGLAAIDVAAKYVTEFLSPYDDWKDYVDEYSYFFNAEGKPLSKFHNFTYAAWAEFQKKKVELTERAKRSGVLLGMSEVFRKDQVEAANETIRGKDETNKTFRMKVTSGLMN